MHSADIDQTIHEVERLYQSITGERPNGGAGANAVIPPEVDPVEYVDNQLDRLLGALGVSGGNGVTAMPNMPGNGTAPVAPAIPQAWTPPLAAWEAPAEYRLRLDVPGLARDGVNVVTQGQAVIVRGVRPELSPEDRARFAARVKESPHGRFARIIPMPPDAALDRIDARMSDGCLEIRIPRVPATERSVDIQ